MCGRKNFGVNANSLYFTCLCFYLYMTSTTLRWKGLTWQNSWSKGIGKIEFYSPMTAIDVGSRVTLNVLVEFSTAFTMVCTTSSSSGMEDAFVNSSETTARVLTVVSVSFAGLYGWNKKNTSRYGMIVLVWNEVLGSHLFFTIAIQQKPILK